MIDIDKMEDNVYVVKSKKNGNEIVIKFNSLKEVSDFVEQEETNILGVWRVTVIKLHPGVYKRRTK